MNRDMTIEDCAQRIKARHRKKDAPFLFEQYFAVSVKSMAHAIEIDRRHERWCAYWAKHCRSVYEWPKLASWMADGTYTVDPPEDEPVPARRSRSQEAWDRA